MGNENQWRDEVEKIQPPKRGPEDQGDVTEPKHTEADKLVPIIPLGQ